MVHYVADQLLRSSDKFGKDRPHVGQIPHAPPQRVACVVGQAEEERGQCMLLQSLLKKCSLHYCQSSAI